MTVLDMTIKTYLATFQSETLRVHLVFLLKQKQPSFKIGAALHKMFLFVRR